MTVMKSERRHFAVTAVCVVLLCGCGGGGGNGSPVAPKSDQLTVVSISPATSTILHPDSQVDLVVRARHHFATASSGKLSLLALTFAQGPLISFPLETALSDAEGETTSVFHLDIPPTPGSPIHVLLTLFPAGATKSDTTVELQYIVR